MTYHVLDHGIEGLLYEWDDEDKQDKWYRPLKSYQMLEYEWVRENVVLEPGTFVIDAGCHNGNYAVVFKPAFVLGVDMVQLRLHRTWRNLQLNNMKGGVMYHVLGYRGLGNMQMVANPDVYKCDIEGSEFNLFPKEIYAFPTVHTWIVEIHPPHGEPNEIADHFYGLGYQLWKVDRERGVVRPYKMGETWTTQATLIARRL